MHMSFVSHSVLIPSNSDEMFRHLVADVCGTVVVVTDCRAELIQGHLMILMAFDQTSLGSSEVSKGVEDSTRSGWELVVLSMFKVDDAVLHRKEILSILPNIDSCFARAMLSIFSAASYSSRKM